MIGVASSLYLRETRKAKLKRGGSNLEVGDRDDLYFEDNDDENDGDGGRYIHDRSTMYVMQLKSGDSFSIPPDSSDEHIAEEDLEMEPIDVDRVLPSIEVPGNDDDLDIIRVYSRPADSLIIPILSAVYEPSALSPQSPSATIRLSVQPESSARTSTTSGDMVILFDNQQES
jgi:hypothetical protein